MQEVGGSIPPGSTRFSPVIDCFRRLSPSSRGLGHHPFTVRTGVRIPVGTPLPAHLPEELRKALKGQAIQRYYSNCLLSALRPK